MTTLRHADPLADLEPLQKFMAVLFWVPSLSVVVFLRHRLGYRMIRPLYFLSAFAALVTLAALSAIITYAVSNIPNPLTPTGVAVGNARQAEQAAAAQRAREISPNAGQISTPQTDPEAYREAPRGYRFKRNPDGTWARDARNPREFIYERIPAQPTVIPPEGGVQAAVTEPEVPAGPSIFSRIPALVWFALPMLGLSVYHRRQGWRLVFTHTWHSMSGGVSHLARVLPWTELSIQRRVEPALVALFGLVVLFFFSSYLFGGWLVFAGVTLAMAEQLNYERNINDLLDRHDARVEARYAADVDAVVQNGGRVPEQHSVSTTGGVLVTVAPELEELLQSDGSESRALSEEAFRETLKGKSTEELQALLASIEEEQAAFKERLMQEGRWGSSLDDEEQRT